MHFLHRVARLSLRESTQSGHQEGPLLLCLERNQLRWFRYAGEISCSLEKSWMPQDSSTALLNLLSLQLDPRYSADNGWNFRKFPSSRKLKEFVDHHVSGFAKKNTAYFHMTKIHCYHNL